MLFFRAFALDLHAYAAGTEFKLLYPYCHAHDTRIFQYMGCYLFGERLTQLNVTARHNRADAVHDDVIRYHMAHIFRVGRQSQHIGGYVEAHFLGVTMLETVGADLDWKNEVADVDLVRAKRRVEAPGEYPRAASNR